MFNCPRQGKLKELNLAGCPDPLMLSAVLMLLVLSMIPCAPPWQHPMTDHEVHEPTTEKTVGARSSQKGYVGKQSMNCLHSTHMMPAMSAFVSFLAFTGRKRPIKSIAFKSSFVMPVGQHKPILLTEPSGM